MTLQIKEISKFQTKDGSNDWCTFGTVEKAKEAEREDLISKFLTLRSGTCPDWRYKKYSGWEDAWVETKTSAAQRNAHESGHCEGQRAAVGDFIKFYPEIIAGLKKIDEAKVIKED